jgi:hypothetical protein
MRLKQMIEKQKADEQVLKVRTKSDFHKAIKERKAEDDVGDIAATFKCVRRMFHVGEVIEFEITKTQEKLAYCPSCFSLGVSG